MRRPSKHDKTFAPAHQKLGHVLLRRPLAQGRRAPRGAGPGPLQGAVDLAAGEGPARGGRRQRRRAGLVGRAGSSCSARRSLTGPDDRRREAEQQLMEIRDPVAVAPAGPGPRRGDASRSGRCSTTSWGRSPGPRRPPALVTHILIETDPDVRHVTMDALAKRKEPNVVPGLVQALGSNDPAVVNRAAWALGQPERGRDRPQADPRADHDRSTRWSCLRSAAGRRAPSAASFGSVAPTPGMGGADRLQRQLARRADPAGRRPRAWSPSARRAVPGTRRCPGASFVGTAAAARGRAGRSPRIVPYTYPERRGPRGPGQADRAGLRLRHPGLAGAGSRARSFQPDPDPGPPRPAACDGRSRAARRCA